MMLGYLDPRYAISLQEFGQPRYLPRCGGWILERSIPGSTERDGTGCYPLFCCRDWSGLSNDLEDLSKDLVAVSLVADPFGSHDEEQLKECFPDVCYAYKDVYVVEFCHDWEESISNSRRKKSINSLKHLAVEECTNPYAHLDEWVELYGILSEKHKIEGVGRFSKDSFTQQLHVSGTVLLKATHQGLTVGMTFWYIQGDVVYGHLAAFSDLGYRLDASYALDWYALQHFASRVRWLYFGGSAGLCNRISDGLAIYKRGWCNQRRPLYFCGRILDKRKYESITKNIRSTSGSYFPAYR